MTVRGTYALVGITVSTFAVKCYVSCIFSEVVISQSTPERSSRTKMQKKGSVEEISVETLARYMRIVKFSS
jgi:hypothetical protein